MKTTSHLAKLVRLRVIRTLFVFSVCLVSFCTIGCSQEDDFEIYSSIHGRVTDYVTGLPLENSSVVLSPTSLTQQTTVEGTFRFENLDAQQYTIIVQKAGYQPNRKTVTAVSGEDMEVNIQLMLIEK